MPCHKTGPNGGMVDTKDLKSFGHCGCVGSSPTSTTQTLRSDGIRHSVAPRVLSSFTGIDLNNGFITPPHLPAIAEFHGGHEFVAGHGLHILCCVAFVYDLNSEHCLDHIFHRDDAPHAAIFVGDNRDVFFLFK